MAYAKIKNLYRPEAQKVLDFKCVYALEKVHGTSAHVAWHYPIHDGDEPIKGLSFFSGGAERMHFCNQFNGQKGHPLPKNLAASFLERVGTDHTTIHGEAYGGKQQGMSKTYGPDLRFIAFDVNIGGTWLSVNKAHTFVEQMGLEFVPWQMVSTSENLRYIDELRDLPSLIAQRRGMGEQLREGIVLRPPFECTDNRGERVCAKHKSDAFGERVHQPKVSTEQRAMMENAHEVAEEFVTPMRLQHVVDKLKIDPNFVGDMTSTGSVMKAMVQDIFLEDGSEILDTKPVRKAIGRATAKLYKKIVTEVKR